MLRIHATYVFKEGSRKHHFTESLMTKTSTSMKIANRLEWFENPECIRGDA